MSGTLKWVGKNLSLGGLVRHAGSAAGLVVYGACAGTGWIASTATSDPERRRKIRDAASSIGDKVGGTIAVAGDLAGSGINKGVQFVSNASGAVAGCGARVAGASEDAVRKTETIGRFVGAVAVGAAVGTGVVDGVIAASSAAGTAGAAATTSGLAALGGGSVAAGGGGIAAGQAVANAVVASASASSVACTIDKAGKD